MSEGMNRVILLGNLGADPELRFTGAGIPVLHLRLATTETFFDKNRAVQERTEWHNVVFWGSRAEGLGKVLSKGDCVFVEGTLRTSSYDKDGLKRWKTEVIGRELRFTVRRSPPPPVDDAVAPTTPPETARFGKSGPRVRLDAPAANAAVEELPF
ncbi:MAG: single-stranded DNA-binding protein [Polyangiaceae bacterium]|nr:single-stranded DNA-binding protein [Polyangiaceae bacterium]